MKRLILFLGLSLLVTSCYISDPHKYVSRVETDNFRITEIDTTYNYHVKDVPENIDRGVVFPSERNLIIVRNRTDYDSIVQRFYPDFIRVGLFESVGLIGGNTDHSIDAGIFGLYPETGFKRDNSIFAGGLYRVGIFESRLRWFQDSPNWSWGTSAVEIIAPNSRYSDQLFAVAPFYLRKRYFFDEDIPYLAATISVGIGLYPSQYINLSGSLDLGSIGGLNIRAYAGLAAGQNPTYTAQNNTNSARTVVAPYLGLGVSVLDFHNKTEELYEEWKDHKHSSWNIGLLQGALIGSNSEESLFIDNNNPENQGKTGLINGFVFRFANASISIPKIDERLYVGTSLLNIVAPGFLNTGIGILPIRVGFWQNVLRDELTVEPFLEYNYYPSNFIHIGARLNLAFKEYFNFSLWAAYANGITNNDPDYQIFNDLGNFNRINAFYIGFGIGLMDKIFLSKELKHNR